MSKYTYIRKHKLNGKKTDITNEIVGMMQINDYLLVTVPKLTKLISEIQETISNPSLTDEGKIAGVTMLISMFEQEKI